VLQSTRNELKLVWSSRPSLFALLQFSKLLHGVHRLPKVGWIVNDPVLIRQVLNDSNHFTLFDEGGGGHMWKQVLGDDIGWLFTHPGHLGFRNRTRDLFTEDNVGPIVAEIFGEPLEQMQERLLAGEQIDVVDLTRVLTGRIIGDFVGLGGRKRDAEIAADGGDPDETYRELYVLVHKLTGLALESLTDTNGSEELYASGREILAVLTREVESAYPEAPPSSLLGRCRDTGLSLTESRALVAIMLVAGTETSSSAITRSVTLLHDTGDMHKLIRDPSKLEDAMRETFRVTTPAAIIGRHVTGDVTVGGKTLPAGDRVLMPLHVANNRPGTYDINRPYLPELRQLWFGGGRHQCLGAPIVRAEMRAFLTALVAIGRPWRVVSRTAERQTMIPAYRSMVIELA
jgi:cytochrome P450